MADEMTMGIPYPDNHEDFLVPPWPTNASFCGVVRHFLRSHPWGVTNTTHLLAFYEGYLRALDAAPRERATNPVHREWYVAMRESIARCVRLYSANNNNVLSARD